jgi:hypothetical protein
MIFPSHYPPISKAKIIVWGMLASHPFGGMTWQVLHYLAGLRRLGFDVWYVEDSENSLLDPTTHWETLDYSENVKYLSRHLARIGLGDRWIFRHPWAFNSLGERDYCLGATDADGLVKLYREADALINLCGANYLRPEHAEIRCLIYLQTDPFADQVRIAQPQQENDYWLREQLDAYKYLFTYGENLGKPECIVPVERYQWQPTRAPICVDWWASETPVSSGAALTTISTWKDLNKDITWRGEKYYWRKDIEFLRFLNLPSKSHLPLELALEGISDNDASKLRDCGWRITAARHLCDPDNYHDYICNSLGEFTVTKDQYVRPKTGWFSDRSVCYLAAGRPVITQETGFSKFIPTGKGLFAFQTEEDILAAIDVIKSDYKGNCRAAYEIAAQYFAAEKIIGSLMEQVGF